MDTFQRLELEELIRSLLHRSGSYEAVDSDAWYSKDEQCAMHPRDQQFSFKDGGQRPVSSILPGVLPFESVTSWRARTLRRLGASGVIGNQQRILPLGKLNLPVPGVLNIGGEVPLMARLLQSEVHERARLCEMKLSRVLFKPARYWMHTHHRACPQCSNAARERFGIEYLTATHAFAFMGICPLHGVQLRNYSTDEIYSYRPKEDRKEWERVGQTLSNHKTEAEAFSQFMNSVVGFRESLAIRRVFESVLDVRIPINQEMLDFYRSFAGTSLPTLSFPRSAEALWAQAAAKFLTFQNFLSAYSGS